VDLRIVPLTTCAKIIQIDTTKQTRVVHNLGIEEDIVGVNNGEKQHAGRRKTSDEEIHIGFLRALCAYRMLLYQLVQYMDQMHSSCRVDVGVDEVDDRGADCCHSIPYPMGEDVIGWMHLSDSNVLSDQDWSAIIHMMVSNLKWVSSLVTV